MWLSADISSKSQQLQMLVKDPLTRTNDKSSALETFSDSGLHRLTFYFIFLSTLCSEKTPTYVFDYKSGWHIKWVFF